MKKNGYLVRLATILSGKWRNIVSCFIFLLAVVVWIVTVEYGNQGLLEGAALSLAATALAGLTGTVYFSIRRMYGRPSGVANPGPDIMSFAALSFLLATIGAVSYKNTDEVSDFNGYPFLALAFVFSFLLAFQYLLLRGSSIVMFLLRMTLAVLFFLESVSMYRPNEKDGQRKYISDPGSKKYFVKDDSLGWKMPSNANIRVVKHDSIHRDTMYNVLMLTDGKGLRDSLCSPAGDRNRLLNLFGCSFTFGEGIHFNETFGHLFERRDSSLRIANRGFRGYGPHQMLVQIMRMSPSECDGDALYTFIPDHLNRVWGGTHYLNYGSSSPDVHILGDSVSIKSRSKAWLNLNKLLRKSKLVAKWNLYLEAPGTEAFMRRFASIVNKSADLYLSKNPGARFFVGLYPLIVDPDSPRLRWLDFLDDRIIVLRISIDPSKIKDYRREDYFLKDSHPRGKMNCLYVDSVFARMEDLRASRPGKAGG